MKRPYIVFTHVGSFRTWAISPAKAIANVRFRVFGRGIGSTKYWTVQED